ncbi:MAG TPA: DUF1232 domain-containing protein [Thermoanaerobaculia bacterium]|nr:DUF1232 domain-containing protein [Thermoanaerobaculia bacterium]
MATATATRPLSEEHAQRIYDRLRANIHRYLARKGGTLGKTAEYLLLVPDVFILLWRLATDSRVTGKDKVLLGSSIAYYIIPFDFIPEALVGPIGYLDDLVFGVYVLNKVLGNVDASVLREHWPGDTDVLESIQRVLNAADSLVSTNVLSKFKNIMK